MEGYSEGVALLSVNESVFWGDKTESVGRGPLSCAGERSVRGVLVAVACFAGAGDPLKTCRMAFQKLRFGLSVRVAMVEEVRGVVAGRGDEVCSRRVTGVVTGAWV